MKITGKNFYLASGLKNIVRAAKIVEELINHGYKVTYDWMMHGNLQKNPERWVEVSQKEANGVMAADFVVILAPGGRGTHVELGIAIGLGKSIFLVAENEKEMDQGAPYTCIFYAHPFVKKVLAPKEQQLQALLGELESARQAKISV